MADKILGEVAADAFDRQSPTAASSTNRIFPSSGEMRYLAILGGSGGGQKGVVVTAATGDEAAAKAAGQNPGMKVVYIGPATDAPPVIDEVSA